MAVETKVATLAAEAAMEEAVVVSFLLLQNHQVDHTLSVFFPSKCPWQSWAVRIIPSIRNAPC
jgi:hypothetical protein